MMLSCMLNIEAGCHTHEEYKAAIKRIHQLIKSGGFLLLYSTMRRDTSTLGWYKVGDETFTKIPLSLEFVYATLKGANLLIVKTECLEIPEYRTPERAAFIVAKKP